MIAFTLSFAGSPPSDGLPLRKVIQAKHLHLGKIRTILMKKSILKRNNVALTERGF